MWSWFDGCPKEEDAIGGNVGRDEIRWRVEDCDRWSLWLNCGGDDDNRRHSSGYTCKIIKMLYGVRRIVLVHLCGTTLLS